MKAPYAGLLVCGACGIWDWRHEDESLLEKPSSEVSPQKLWHQLIKRMTGVETCLAAVAVSELLP